MKVKIINQIIFLSSIISFSILIFNFSFFYESIILRGLNETLMWINNVKHGDYARPYYFIIEYISTETNLDIFLTTILTSLICFLYCLYRFKVTSSIENLVFFLIVFNILSLLLFFSPGRTSLTIAGLIFCYSCLYPKIKFFRLAIGLLFLFYLHSASLVTLAIFLVYDMVILTINKLSVKVIVKYILKLLFYLLTFVFFYIVLYFDNDYIHVNNNSGNIAVISMMVIISFLVLHYTNFDYFILLLIIISLYLLAFEINATYTYRVIFLPLSLAIFIKKICYRN
uniref:Wzy n=1 Tax=Providencia stuartii TaxID=588 RepID=A0A346CLF7_PROST|nr:hypothetical protein [Providencia stuartii]